MLRVSTKCDMYDNTKESTFRTNFNLSALVVEES